MAGCTDAVPLRTVVTNGMRSQELNEPIEIDDSDDDDDDDDDDDENG